MEEILLENFPRLHTKWDSIYLEHKHQLLLAHIMKFEIRLDVSPFFCPSIWSPPLEAHGEFYTYNTG